MTVTANVSSGTAYYMRIYLTRAHTIEAKAYYWC